MIHFGAISWKLWWLYVVKSFIYNAQSLITLQGASGDGKLGVRAPNKVEGIPALSSLSTSNQINNPPKQSPFQYPEVALPPPPPPNPSHLLPASYIRSTGFDPLVPMRTHLEGLDFTNIKLGSNLDVHLSSYQRSLLFVPDDEHPRLLAGKASVLQVAGAAALKRDSKHPSLGRNMTDLLSRLQEMAHVDPSQESSVYHQ